MSQATKRASWRALALAVLSVAALALAGIAAATASAETTWLCKPGIANNPCTSSEETTVQLANGSSFIEHAQPAANAPIDCFYVYPTVSSQFTMNANEEIGPEETQIAIDQASRFSQTCKVYAPIYKQLTIPAINTPGGVTAEGSAIAYGGVLAAFEEYMAKYNKGRGFVLIGHSQGALLLEQLIKEKIDTSASLRKQMVSAIILGGNVLVPKGQRVGGTFQNVPSCLWSGETHCVTAYSSFLKEPPAEANFGRVNSPLVGTQLPEEVANELEVLCVNPSVTFQKLGPKSGPLLTYESTGAFPGLLGEFVKAPSASTPWVATPAEYNGQCESANGASWLNLSHVLASDPREQVAEVLGPAWGTHLVDVNIGLGNLVIDVEAESLVYSLTH
jgi:hypothetical protein